MARLRREQCCLQKMPMRNESTAISSTPMSSLLHSSPHFPRPLSFLPLQPKSCPQPYPNTLVPYGLPPQGVKGLQPKQDHIHELGDQQHTLIPAAKLQPKVPNPTESTTLAPAKPQPNEPKPRALPVVLLDRYDHSGGGGREDQQLALVLAATSQPKGPKLSDARTSGSLMESPSLEVTLVTDEVYFCHDSRGPWALAWSQSLVG